MSDRSVIVGQRDSAESIAASNGLTLDKVWQHANNWALRELRKDPHVLFPGDQLFVPELEPKWVPASTDQRHQFVRKGIPSKLHLVLLEGNRRPVTNQPFILTVEGQIFQGNTGSSGVIQHSIPPGAKSGKLTVGSGKKQRVYSLSFGGLDPVTEVSGVQGRLKNLGFAISAVDGQLGPEVVEALRQFQQGNGLDSTGDFDDATQAKLKELHGC